MNVTPTEFIQMTGRAPIQDDLERTNCPKAGTWGHSNCGICPDHQKPRFECGCVHNHTTKEHPELF